MPSATEALATERQPSTRGDVAEPTWTERLDHVDPVDLALSNALTAAAAAGRFDVVAQLANELEARRLAAAPNVVDIAEARHRGRRS